MCWKHLQISSSHVFEAFFLLIIFWAYCFTYIALQSKQLVSDKVVKSLNIHYNINIDMLKLTSYLITMHTVVILKDPTNKEHAVIFKLFRLRYSMEYM